MADSLLLVANGALLRLGAQPLDSLSESNDRTTLVNQWLTPARKQSLRAHPWNFAMRRARLSTYPAAGLTLSALTGDGVTATADASVFAATDVGYRISASPGTARIVSYTSATVVTVDVDTDFGATSFAREAWRIAPLFGWAYRFGKPTNYLRIVEVAPTSGVGSVHAPWRWSPAGVAGNEPEPVKIEGQYLVSDAGPSLDVAYIQDVSDPTLWDANFDNAIEALLAFRICYGVTGSLQAAKTQWDAYMMALSEARTTDAQEGSPDDSGSDVLIAVRY